MQPSLLQKNSATLPSIPPLTISPPKILPFSHHIYSQQAKHLSFISGTQQQNSHQAFIDDHKQQLHNKELQSKINITELAKCFRCQKWMHCCEISMHMTFHAAAIIPNLYLGDRFSSESRKELIERLKITHVVNAASQLRNFFQVKEEITYLKLQLGDTMAEDIIEPCVKAAQFIYKALEGNPTHSQNKSNSIDEKDFNKIKQNNVFVHCAMGKSRSVAVILLYLMKYQGKGLSESLQLVKEKRSLANPNPSYMRQLQLYQTQISKKKVYDPAE